MCPWCPSPFTLLPGGTDFIIHVSQLAAHTKDMLAGPQVSLLVIAPPAPGVMAQELARITVQGEAVQVVAGKPGHAAAKAAYLARFPQSEMMFGFFRLLAVRNRAGFDPLRRWICPGHDDFSGKAAEALSQG
jgi:putative heme iron utilization protein